PLGEIEPLPGLFDPRGWIAFALGAIGFALAYWYFRSREALGGVEDAPSYRAATWVRVIADAGNAVAGGLSRAHSGALATYALGSFIGVALILLVRELAR